MDEQHSPEPPGDEPQAEDAWASQDRPIEAPPPRPRIAEDGYIDIYL